MRSKIEYCFWPHHHENNCIIKNFSDKKDKVYRSVHFYPTDLQRVDIISNLL